MILTEARKNFVVPKNFVINTRRFRGAQKRRRKQKISHALRMTPAQTSSVACLSQREKWAQ